MPINIISNRIKIKNEDGEYIGIDAMTDATTEDRIAAVNAAGTQNINSLNARGTELKNVIISPTRITNDSGLGIIVENGAATASSVQMEEVKTAAKAEAADWLTEHISSGYAVDNTLSISGAAADAKVTGDELTDLKSAFCNNVVRIEDTNFTTNISGIESVCSLTDIDSNYITYPLLSIANDKFATSSTYNSYLFKVPFYGFKMTAFVARCYVLNSKPTGTNGEALSITEKLKDDSGSSLGTLTINYPKGTYVVFNTTASIASANLSAIQSNLNVPYKSARLELDGIQDSFARYSVRSNDVSTYGNIKLNITKEESKKIVDTTGALTDDNTIDTYIFQVPVSQISITCTNGIKAARTWIDPHNCNTVRDLKQSVYTSGDARVDTFTATYGDYVEISIEKTNTLDLRTDYIKEFTLPSLRLDYMQQNSFYKYFTSGGAKYLYIYYKSGNKFVRWELHNTPVIASNSNTWQIGRVCGLNAKLENLVELVTGGEFELAFKEYGANDYCGGANHGDENTVDFTLFIDGKQITLAELDGEYHAFNRIDAIEHALINRCDTPAENILKHQKVWTFENGTVKVRQTLEFLETLQCDFLCCMLTALRAVFPYGVRQGRVGIENMTSSGFERVNTTGNEMMYLMYGPDVTAKVTAQTCDHTPDAKLWINDVTNDERQIYQNKLYYNFYGGIPNTSVAANTVLYWEQEYDIAYA